jgi:hypothetical protein
MVFPSPQTRYNFRLLSTDPQVRFKTGICGDVNFRNEVHLVCVLQCGLLIIYDLSCVL